MVAPLPVVKPDARRQAEAGLPPRRVFICDDDLEFADELASALTRRGFEVRTLAGVDSPVALLSDFKPDTVLLDIYMPPPDGFEILGHVARDPRRDDISLVMMSGSGTALLEMAARFCLAHRIHLAGAFQKPLMLQEIERLCRAPQPDGGRLTS